MRATTIDDRITMKLNTPKRIRGTNRKKEMQVYVYNPAKDKVTKIKFGDPDMRLRRNNPEAKAAYCARSKPLSKQGDKLSPNYWSRKRWRCRNP